MRLPRSGGARPGPVRGRRALSLLAALLVVAPGCMEEQVIAPELDELEDEAEAAVYYPDRDEWQRRAPRQAGLDPELLDAAVELARSRESDIPVDVRSWLQERLGGGEHQEILGPVKQRGPMSGVVVRAGYIVAEWGDTERADMAFSVTKSFLSTLAGVARREGLIPDLDAPVGQLVDDGGYDSRHNAAITWDHTLRQTSEWEGELWDKPDTADRREGRDRRLQEPGTFWEYNDVRVNRAALSLSRVWKAPLPEVLRRHVMGRIGAGNSWRWHGYRNSTVSVDGREIESVSGGGHWGGGLWIASRDLARWGYLWLREGSWDGRRILPAEYVERALTPTDVKPTYGYMLWLNTDGELWPGVPESSYAALGGGSHVVWVSPEQELVAVVRWIERDAVGELLAALSEAVTGPVTGAGTDGAGAGS
ncbi:MAG: serine hydrolase domain-containing protein [Acidobacteriota bacterium]